MIIIGHRGARGLAPENTVAGLLKAVQHNVDLVELDLRVTSDGVVVLHHNRAMIDRAGNKLVIAEHPFKALKDHKADLATFEQAAESINRKVPILIEIKPKVDTAPIVKAIKVLLNKGWQPQDLLLASRDYRILLRLHVALPALQTGVIERWSGVRGTWRARRLGTRRLYMNRLWLWRGFIVSMRRRGWELYPYTLNNPAQARRWARFGIAGIITDYPDRFETKK